MISAIDSLVYFGQSRFLSLFSPSTGWRSCAIILAGFALLGWPQRSFAQDGEAVPSKPGATQSEPEEQPRSEEPPSASEQGIVRVVVFVDELPLSGAEIVVEGSGEEPALTDDDGAAQLSVSDGGVRYLVVRVPRAALPEASPGEGLVEIDRQEVELVLGETVEVLMTLSKQGTVLSFEAEGVAGTVKEEREASATSSESQLPRGTLHGRVLDSEKNQPVLGARVYVRGSSAEATTDAEGKFSLDLPEGLWTLSVIHPNYTTATQPDVEVSVDEERNIDFQLLPASTELEDFVITVPHVEGSVASVLTERRESAAMSDAISAEDISKTPAGDAAGAAQRVVGVTIVDGKFVYVRGLGERYTNSLLNGSPMPSPEPDKATVPLDLLPTQVIRSIDIAKTSTPDFPADFAGGSVRIETITVPEDPIFGISLKSGYNSQSTFRRVHTFKASPTDWLGFDSGQRGLPDLIPRDYRVKRGERKPDGERLTREEVTESALALNSPMSPHEKNNLPKLGGSIIGGNGWDLAKEARLGALASFTYSRTPSLRKEIIRQFDVAAGRGEPRIWVDGEATTATDTVRWGAFGSVGFKFLEHHEVSLIGLRSQIADDTTRQMNFFYANNDGTYGSIRNEYTSRSLEFSQLRGLHDFPALFDSKFDWRLALGRAFLDRPDMRDAVFGKQPADESYSFASNNDAGRHFFADMVENSRSAYVDYTQPIQQGDYEKKLKVGGGINTKHRVFKARRFSYSAHRSVAACGPEYDPSCAADLFTDENINEGLLVLQEDTQENDAYVAQTEVLAGYGMADFKLFKPLRFIGGVRVEKTDQLVSVYNQFDPEDDEDLSKTEFKSTDVMPSFSLIYALTRWMELRAAASRTVARPQLREIGPFQFSDYFGGFLVNGNPDLEMTKVLNADLRADIFPSPSEVVSLSVFAKDFTDPIEPVVIPAGTSSIQTFRNANGAFLYGFELEARKNLEFLSPVLRHFGIMGNLTMAASRIDIDQTGTDGSGQVSFITTTERPMVNQAPYVINLALDFDLPDKTQARLLYNVSGKQIVSIGTSGLPDSYQHSRHLLDFTFTQHLTERIQLGASVENILNSLFLVTQGKERDLDRVTYSYRTGVSVGAQIGYSL